MKHFEETVIGEIGQGIEQHGRVAALSLRLTTNTNEIRSLLCRDRDDAVHRVARLIREWPGGFLTAELSMENADGTRDDVLLDETF